MADKDLYNGISKFFKYASDGTFKQAAKEIDQLNAKRKDPNYSTKKELKRAWHEMNVNVKKAYDIKCANGDIDRLRAEKQREYEIEAEKRQLEEQRRKDAQMNRKYAQIAARAAAHCQGCKMAISCSHIGEPTNSCKRV